MATYNGRRFLDQQLTSIVEQMDPTDELLVYDDGSTDGTPDHVMAFGDRRIRLVRSERNVGVNEAFARAIGHASQELIFMADQDDIWTPGRLDLMTAAFADERTTVVASNHALIDAAGQPIPGSRAPNLRAEFDRQKLASVVGILCGNRNYFGCTMAFRASLRDWILPFPHNVESHDIWIAIVGLASGGLVHLPAVTLLHRVHESNASIIQRPLREKLRARQWLLSQFISAWQRGRAHGGTHLSDAA
jgi:glycosyltransferase involved in cell wall biosynthesis